MQSLLVILWFIGLVISIEVIFHFIGFSGLTRMFPEGWREWHPFAQYGSLAAFAAFVHFPPF